MHPPSERTDPNVVAFVQREAQNYFSRSRPSMSQAAALAYFSFRQLIQQIDGELGDVPLAEVDAGLAEDDRSVIILLRGKASQWFSAGVTLKQPMRPHVFRAELRDKLEAFVVAELALWRTGYGNFPSGILTDAEMELFA